MNLLERLLSSPDWAPHGYCFLWFPQILWLEVISDGLIALAYFAIPTALVVFAWRRRELPFPWLFVMFAAFITACGLTHIMGIWTVWRPDYGAEGLMKAVCALISVATAMVLIPVIPKALALKGPRELEGLNLRLADEVGRHRTTALELARAHGELETRVNARTAELAASEGRYRALVEAIASVVWTTSADGLSVDVPEWRALTGQSVAAARGLGWLDAVHPEDRSEVEAAWGRAVRDHTPYDVEYRVRQQAKGDWHWLGVRGLPVRDEAGRVREWVGVCIDIDERKRAEAELRLSEARYRALVETSPQAVYVHQDGVITVANRQAASLLGAKEPGELIGRHVLEELIEPESLPLARARTGRLVRPGDRIEPAELSYRRLDGTPLPVEAAAVAVLIGGRLAVQVAFHDITARKAAQGQQQLLLAELSHRVKNTLAVVQGIAAQSLAGGRSLEEAREALGNRLRALANAHTLLTASEWQGASLHALIEGELQPYGRRAEIVGKAVTLTPKETLTLSLVLHELATNAAKYGALSVPEGRVAVGWSLTAGADGSSLLHLVWQERGGPAVHPPLRHGFGRTLVEQAIAYDLRGKARLDFAPTGVSYELEAALGLAA